MAPVACVFEEVPPAAGLFRAPTVGFGSCEKRQILNTHGLGSRVTRRQADGPQLFLFSMISRTFSGGVVTVIGAL